MIRKNLTFVALLAATSSNFAQTTERNIRSMSLQEAISLALQHNFDIQIQQFDPTISKFNISIAYGAYDPLLSISGQHSYSQSPGGVNPATSELFPGVQSESDSFNTSLSGLLPTGLTYSLAGSVSDQTITQP